MLYNTDATLREGMASLSGRNIELVAIMHTEVEDIDPCLDVFDEMWQGPVGVYAHSGEFQHPNWIFNDVISIDDYAAAVQGWRDRGVQVLGGCCGISPDHIAALSI
jgi:S-methylmethionine-dependent homocysteine/selenocysteine methylase